MNTDERLPCQTGPADRFFPSPSAHPTVVARTKAECRPCPTREACLRYALRWNVDGLWAGTDPDERATLRDRAGIVAQPIVAPTMPREIIHGSTSGASTHRRRGEAPCRLCLDAASRKQQEQKDRRARQVAS